MLFFNRKPAAVTDLGWIGTDIHSHLLPGIDDGAQDTAAALELVQGLRNLGFQKLVTTPHVLWEMYSNTTEIIGQQCASLNTSLQEAGSPVTVQAAAEYYIDDHFQDLLQNKEPLLTIKDNIVLVEFSMMTAPLDLQEIIFEMQLQGYQPLIAHPERYIYLRNRKSFLDDLKDNGCWFQLNLMSLTPYYGVTVQELAKYGIERELYTYAGTDLHNAKQLAILQKVGASPLYARLKDSEQLKNHLL